MNILLIALGSAGDVNPMIRLGAALKTRGHSVTVVASAYFEVQIRRAGLEVIALGTIDEYHAATSRSIYSPPTCAARIKRPRSVACHCRIGFPALSNTWCSEVLTAQWIKSFYRS
jgi:UDP:flavonoid glycosyltransferase YjiC (YdhE family)